MTLTFGSVCSGIEAASVAWHPLGWRAVFFSEIDPFPSAVLAHRYPDVPNLGDMTRFEDWPDAAFDVLVGGTPCQSFSVAGLRTGLDDPRGSLMLTYLAIARRYRTRWLVWENVPGVLSADRGRAFGALLRGMAELGYGFAYRVLDAQYVRTLGLPFAVPQRRRRVFVVGHTGDWRPAAAVLFDRESLSGNSPPRREAGEGFAGGARAGSYLGNAEGGAGAVPFLTASNVGKQINNQTPLFASSPLAFDARQSDVCVYGNRAGPLDIDGFSQAVAFDPNQITSKASRSTPRGDVLHTLPATALPPHLASRLAVRRLTPRECERLQGFPDDWTLIPYRRGMAADGPRYKALGNSMAVNVMQWLGERIASVEAMTPQAHKATS